jgi:hypothetical protein
MPIAGAIVVLIQFCFAFHVLKSGRPYWWIFIIMAFPVMGCVIYYFVEVFPGSREHRSANKVARRLARALQPDEQLKKRAEELEVCGSVDNKIALAAECMSHDMFGEAIRLYESCLQGPYAADGTILFGLARAAVEAGEWDKAGPALYKLKNDAPKVRPLEVRLLQARVLEARGETDAALAMFRQLIPVFVGLEARYRYGELLLHLGKQEAAMEMFNEVLRHSKRFTSAVEEEERWASAARQAVSGA